YEVWKVTHYQTLPALLNEIWLGVSNTGGGSPNMQYRDLMVIVGRSPINSLVTLASSVSIFGDSYSAGADPATLLSGGTYANGQITGGTS
ncbi:hypothetical protein ABTM58_19920, partial [Acinetobacter baumannii]